MPAWFNLLFGEYAYQMLLQILTIAENLMPVVLFACVLKRRSHFPLRALLSLAMCVGVHFGFAVLRTNVVSFPLRASITLMQYLTLLPMLFFCIDEAGTTILLTWCAGVAAENVASRLYSLTLEVLGRRSREDITIIPGTPLWVTYVLYFTFRIGVHLILFAIFGKIEQNSMEKSDKAKVTVLAMITTVVQSFLYVVALEFYNESRVLYNVVQCYSVIMWLFVLMIRSGILFEAGYRQEIAIMERVMREERKQYQAVKENMDVINMRVHDLKHRFSELSDKLTDEEITTLQEAVNLYDSNIKTGCEVLDTLLYEKQMVCRAEGITLSCMANGSLLTFMHTRHIYSLFNNALLNAIEAVRKLENPEKRCVGVSVVKKSSNVDISVYNYFSGEIPQLPEGESTKEDRNHHGYGLMSMRYIVELYHGTLDTEISGEVFTLHILLPAGEKKGEKQ